MTLQVILALFVATLGWSQNVLESHEDSVHWAFVIDSTDFSRFKHDLSDWGLFLYTLAFLGIYSIGLTDGVLNGIFPAAWKINLLETKIPYLKNQYPVLKRLDHSDREIIACYAEKYNQFSCEFSFPSLYLWDDIYHYKLSFFKDWLIVFDTRYDYILMPMGEDISLLGLLTLSTSLKQDGYSGNISNVPPDIIERHPEISHYYDIENERDLAEYIYSTEKLYALKGKKLRKKKNHISQFLRKYPDYQVRPMDSTAVRKDCLALIESMVESMLAENQTVSNSIREEAIVIKKGFESFDSIPLEGIAIYIKHDLESKLVGFSVYSRLNKDIFTIHFEKINYSYRGAAQIINWETAKVLKDKCRYINREQDLGIPGLRQAKLSYEPELIYPAYFLRFNLE